MEGNTFNWNALALCGGAFFHHGIKKRNMAVQRRVKCEGASIYLSNDGF